MQTSKETFHRKYQKLRFDPVTMAGSNITHCAIVLPLIMDLLLAEKY